MSVEFPLMGQGPAKKATDEDKDKEGHHFTRPNLHRRIQDPATTAEPKPPILDKKYELGIYGVNSYRTTEFIVHDEESTTCEIP